MVVVDETGNMKRFQRKIMRFPFLAALETCLMVSERYYSSYLTTVLSTSRIGMGGVDEAIS